MKERGRGLVRRLSGRITHLVGMSLVGIIALFMAALLIRDHSASQVTAIYAHSIRASNAYNEGYLNILASRTAIDGYFQYRKAESYQEALALLEAAHDDLAEVRELSSSSDQRRLIDLQKMVETCQETNRAAFQVLAPGAESGYKAISDAQHKYELLEMIYADGWTDMMDKLSAAQRAALDKKRTTDAISLAAVLAALGLVAVLSAAVLRRVNRIIAALNAYARQFSSGELDVPRLKAPGDDDFKPMVDALNQLVDEIRRSIREREEKRGMELRLAQEMLQKVRIEAALRKSQIKELQSGLNPHFLFNTLNLIASTAYLENAMKTRRLMEALSLLMRRTIDHPSILVDVRSEVETLEQYILIQRERFEGRIEFSVEVEQGLDDVYLPAITLQPIVENSILHGLRDKPRGTVSIRLYQANGRLLIDVIDDGCGIEEEKIGLLTSGQLPSGDHYGLPAVFERIRLIYGQENVAIEIASDVGHWTRVHLEFPFKAVAGGKDDADFGGGR